MKVGNPLIRCDNFKCTLCFAIFQICQQLQLIPNNKLGTNKVGYKTKSGLIASLGLTIRKNFLAFLTLYQIFLHQVFCNLHRIGGSSFT